jgi:[protein-PII] uridylyltransferase
MSALAVVPQGFDAPAVPDRAALSAEILHLLAGVADAKAARALVVRHLTTVKTDAAAALAAAFLATPRSAHALIAAQSALTDALVEAALAGAVHLHPISNPTEAERIAVLAVGGYGRAEMAPHSDVDLLFLTPWKITPWAESVIETMLYILWDLKLKVGHSSRTVKDCIRLGREDITIRTALLEHRFLCGHAALAADLDAKLWSELFKNSGPEFIDAKLAERAERHKRQGGQRYVLEPNVKEGKGGLRDLQTLYWIGKYLHRVPSSGGLVAAGLLSREEFDSFARAVT